MSKHQGNGKKDLIVLEAHKGSKTYTGAEYLVNALVSAGVTHVFGGHGGAVVGLVDAIVNNPNIEWVYMKCEVNASQAVEEYDFR